VHPPGAGRLEITPEPVAVFQKTSVIGPPELTADPVILAEQGNSVRLPGGNAIVDGAVQVERYLLGQKGGFQSRSAGHRAAVGWQVAIDQLQQGGLACAVAADQADAFPAFDLQIRPVEERLSAKAEAHLFQGHQCHLRVLVSSVSRYCPAVLKFESIGIKQSALDCGGIQSAS
jgi:hypothetical protein